MDNNEITRPDISFGGDDSAAVDASANEAAKDIQNDDIDSSAVITAANEKISEHTHSIDEALSGFEKSGQTHRSDNSPIINSKSMSDEDRELAEEFAMLSGASKKKSRASSSRPANSNKAVSKNFGNNAASPKQHRPRPSEEFQEKTSGTRKKEREKDVYVTTKRKREHILNSSIITGLTLTIAIVSISVVLATGAITLGMEYLGINKPNKSIRLTIPEGSNNDEIADILIANDIIENKRLFKVALRLKHQPTLFPGDIELSPNKSYPDIIQSLSEMRQSYETVTLTFKEGTNLYAVAKKLEKNGVVESKEEFLTQFNMQQDFEIDGLVTRNVDTKFTMEGFCFPDTYEFYLDDSAYNVSKIIRDNFASKITDEMYERMKEMDMSLSEVVTLASIVQKEAANADQMPDIAAVFLNRLKDPDTFPNLQSDATGNYVKNVIKKVENSSVMLERYENVYNTYICFGLPAGPISNPGLDAINAVLYPADSDYLYFCHNLETGEMFLAKTDEEHEENLKKAGLKK